MGFVFEDEVKGGRVPREYIPAVERGIREVLAEGVYAKVPVVDVLVRLVDGSAHDVDSSEMAFKICARQAFREAFMKGRPQLLEPVFMVNVFAPMEFSGSVTGNICSRRGRITGIEPRGDGSTQLITAMAPLAEMFGYATDLRSITSGRGSFDMRFSRYEAVPASLAEEIVKQRQGLRAGHSA